MKVPKGTRDLNPTQMAIRNKLLETIVNVFKARGAVTIETPVFELKDVLTSKYGKESKLIYDLADQGGESCSLRYDLTVPFSRFCAMKRIKKIKRYQIGRVYRRDNPAMSSGRFREFYQCDFDIAGEFDLMIPDAECLATLCEVLDVLDIGKYVVKLNDRRLLDATFALSGVPPEKFRTISSSIDKLDKIPWEAVRTEMIEKGLSCESADEIQRFVQLCGDPRSLLDRIRSEEIYKGNDVANVCLTELETLIDYLDCYGILDRFSLDLSLARGLDYYTGIIFEAVIPKEPKIGSIAAGGRYDNLIGQLGGSQIPSVGFSLGIERIFSFVEKRYEKLSVRTCETDVFVCSIDKDCIRERMKMCALLWKNGIKAETTLRSSPKIQSQLSVANKANIPWAVIFGKRELENGVYILKDLYKNEQVEIPATELVEQLKKRIEPYQLIKADTHRSC